MSSIQQFEKLSHLHDYFENAAPDSLESEVAKERISHLMELTEKLMRQRQFLREERRRLRITTDFIATKKKSLDLLRRSDFMPSAVVQELTTNYREHVLLNIGGLIFEVPVAILARDPSSLLAQLTTVQSSIGNTSTPLPGDVAPDIDGIFYFNRSWWLFRYILMFLRDGVLPDDRTLLAKLYRESGFWKLSQLQAAIEEEKLHLRGPPEDKDKANEWWRTLPSWFTAVANDVPPAPPPPPTDWWVDGSYKGKTFWPLSEDPEKVVTAAGEADEKKMCLGTWSIPPSYRNNRYNFADAETPMPGSLFMNYAERK